MNKLKLCLIVFSIIGSVNLAKAQSKYMEHLKAMYQNASMKYAFSKYKPGQYKKWQKQFRTALKAKLGLDCLENQYKGYVPTAFKRETEDAGYAIRERWTIVTEPGVELPIVVMLPKNLTGKVPLMITPHGHSKNTELFAGVYLDESERKLGEEGERNIAVQAVQAGFVAIAPTTRGFGETRSDNDKMKENAYSCRDLAKRDALVGRTLVGDRVWDIMKIIDWALANLPVDGKNIIVSGNSGGGTATLYAGALDTRISMSLPASAFSGFVPSIGLIEHCECNYVPGIMNLGDMGDIAALTVPRPFCAIQGVKDNIFPIEGAREAFKTVKKVYEAAGVPDNCELYEGPEGHRYYKAGAWTFIRKHLK